MAITNISTDATNVRAMSQPEGRANFFQSCVERMLTYWREHDAIKNLDITILDRERNRILKNIILGLDLQPLWPLVKALVLAFAPYMERRGFWDAWQTVLEQAIRMAQAASDREAETTLTALLARLSQRMGRHHDVVRHYRRVIQLARQTGNRFEKARACSNLGYLFIDSGHWWRSEVLSKHGLAIFNQLESDHGRAHTHNHLGLLYIRRHLWIEAEEELENACSIWQRIGDTHSLTYGLINLGLLFLESAHPQQALLYLKEAEHQTEITGDLPTLGRIWSNMAYAHRLLQNRESAYHFANDAEEIFRRYTDQLGLAYVWHHYALLKLQDGALQEAVYYRQSAIEIYQRFHDHDKEQQLKTEYEQLLAQTITTDLAS